MEWLLIKCFKATEIASSFASAAVYPLANWTWSRPSGAEDITYSLMISAKSWVGN